MGYPIAIAGAFFLLGCVLLSLGWRVRKPNVYVRGSGASFPNITEVNKLVVYPGASVGLSSDDVSITESPKPIITTLELRGGNFRGVPDPVNP